MQKGSEGAKKCRKAMRAQEPCRKGIRARKGCRRGIRAFQKESLTCQDAVDVRVHDLAVDVDVLGCRGQDARVLDGGQHKGRQVLCGCCAATKGVVSKR